MVGMDCVDEFIQHYFAVLLLSDGEKGGGMENTLVRPATSSRATV